jgi:hypothetical protein
MKYRKSLLAVVMAAAMQLPMTASAADAPAITAMDGWAKAWATG